MNTAGEGCLHEARVDAVRDHRQTARGGVASKAAQPKNPRLFTIAHFFKVPMNANNGFRIQARSASTDAFKAD